MVSCPSERLFLRPTPESAYTSTRMESFVGGSEVRQSMGGFEEPTDACGSQDHWGNRTKTHEDF